MRASPRWVKPRPRSPSRRPEEKLGFLTLKSGSAARQGQDPRGRHQRQVPRRERCVAGSAHAEHPVFTLHARQPRARRELEIHAGRLRTRGHAAGDARGLGAAADQPGAAAGLPGPLPAWLPRADHVQRVSAALSTGADQAWIRTGGWRSRTTCAPAWRGCAACSTRAAALPTGRASGTPAGCRTGATTGARRTPDTSCSKPRRRATPCPAT